MMESVKVNSCINLLYDLECTQPNNSGKRHGGGKYAEVVFFRMAEIGAEFSCYYDSRKWINPQIIETVKNNNITLYDLKSTSLDIIIKTNNITRIYSSQLEKETVHWPENCELFGTLHGLRSLETPNDWYFFKYKNSNKDKVKFVIGKIFPRIWEKHIRKQYLERYFDIPMHIITVSEHSRNSITAYFPEYKKDIRTYYSPNTSSKIPVEKNSEAAKYFLMVSGNRWEKNNLRGIMAFDRLVSIGLIGDDLNIKVTGCSTDTFNYKVQNPDRFEFLGYVDEDVLERLYANAYCFVYPSLNEGFGYPPLEAMRYRVPVIASPFTSIAEVCGGGVMFFNPYSIEEIMSRMLLVLNPEVHDKYSALGYKRYLQVRERQERDLDEMIKYITT